MKKLLIVISLALFLFGCATMKVENNTVLFSTDAPAIVIIAGSNPEPGWGKKLKDTFPGATVITPLRKYFPLSEGAEELLLQIREAGVTSNNLWLVGHSWGGKLAEEIAARHPGLVRRAVLIARPGFEEFPGMPWFVSAMLRPSEDSGMTEYFVIAGITPKATERWWMMPNEDGIIESDGVVSVGEATTLTGGRKAKQILIVRGEEGEHTRILSSEKVVSWVKAQLEEPKSTLVDVSVANK